MFKKSIRRAVRWLLSLFFIFPMKKRRIFFESYHGRGYLCNPKYICEYLKDYYNGRFQLVWSFEDPSEWEWVDGIKAVKRNSLKYFYYRLTSKILINNMADAVYIPKRKGQVLINTWHAGGAYKRVGQSREDLSDEVTKSFHALLSDKTDYYLSSSKVFTKYNIRGAYDYHGRVVKSGMPRNDIFFDEWMMGHGEDTVREYYGLKDEAVVLYAPTFRGDFTKADACDFTFPVDAVAETFSQKTGKKTVVMVRGHHSLGESLGSRYDNVIDATEYPDMQELLCAADMLITDYSSSIWDFALLKRPCMLYVPDRRDYEENPGTFVDIREWPGFICEDEQSLVDHIKTYTDEAVSLLAEEHLKMMGSYDKGDAAKKVCGVIIKEIKNRL